MKFLNPLKGHPKISFALKSIGILFVLAVLAIVFLFIFFAKDLPRPEKFTEKQVTQSTKIFDRTGEVLLYEIYGEENRTVVPLSSMPESFKQAVIATEDANFYHHFGMDLKRTFLSIISDLKSGQPTYGGSTIDQQLIRSTFFSTEKTAVRKIREIILALELDHRYSKDQILEWYLNQVPFGQNSYGVEAASETYFKKSVTDLSLAESALLAALIKGPSYYSPYGSHKDELLARKNYVLDRMAIAGFITQEEADAAKNEELTFTENIIPIKAPHFTLWVRDYLVSKYGDDFLMNNGLKVYTSLDWNLQQQAEDMVKKWAAANKSYNAYNAALVAIDPKTGEVLAMVGSADWYATSSYPADCNSTQNTCLFDPKFNVAVGSASMPGRQPGSSFKPFVYATAFENGFTDTTTVMDLQTDFGIWGGQLYIPKNYDDRFRGSVTLREALAQSLNIPSIRVLALAGTSSLPSDVFTSTDFTGQEQYFSLGVQNSIKTAQSMGITTLNGPLSSYGPSLVLGGGEVKLLDMVSAYGVFATGGMKVPPVSILKIEDSNGNVIEENEKTPQRVLPAEPVELINDILSDNNARAPVFGAASSLYFPNYQVAVKTGTTQDYRDGWIIGYTPSIAVGVWSGNNNNAPMKAGVAGVQASGPLWHEFMSKVLATLPQETFPRPYSQTSTSQGQILAPSLSSF